MKGVFLTGHPFFDETIQNVLKKRDANTPLRFEDFKVLVNTGLNLVSQEKETLFNKVEIYLSLLNQWQKRYNLVGDTTLQDPWRRHFLDSIQLCPLISKKSKTLVDMGSGAGFPGLVIAMTMKKKVHIVENNHRKCAFMREVACQTKTDVFIHNMRLEIFAGKYPGIADIIFARALAPLNQLFGYAQPLLAKKGICLFLKGRHFNQELLNSMKIWTYQWQKMQSFSETSGVVLKIAKLVSRHLS